MMRMMKKKERMKTKWMSITINPVMSLFLT